jgi:hypothetical protein
MNSRDYVYGFWLTKIPITRAGELYFTSSICSAISVVPTTKPSHLTSCPMYCVSSLSSNAGPVLRRKIYRLASAVSMNTATRSLLLPFPYAPCVTHPCREVTRIGCVELIAIIIISSALMINAIGDDAAV